MESFTIITTEPNELVRPVHNRMPVILRQEDEEQWLDVARTTSTKARLLLKPLPAELMDAHDVSPIVNSAKYDGPECIRPASDDDKPSNRHWPCCDIRRRIGIAPLVRYYKAINQKQKRNRVKWHRSKHMEGSPKDRRDAKINYPGFKSWRRNYGSF